MGIAYGQIPASWHRLGQNSTRPCYCCFRQQPEPQELARS